MKNESDRLCGYCKVFFRSPVFKGEKIIQRRCGITGNLVMLDTPACKDYFSPYPIVQCRMTGERIHYQICFHRRKNTGKYNRYALCKKCPQFLEIKEHYNQIVTEKKTKRPKLKRRKRNGKTLQEN